MCVIKSRKVLEQFFVRHSQVQVVNVEIVFVVEGVPLALDNGLLIGRANLAKQVDELILANFALEDAPLRILNHNVLQLCALLWVGGRDGAKAIASLIRQNLLHNCLLLLLHSGLLRCHLLLLLHLLLHLLLALRAQAH